MKTILFNRRQQGFTLLELFITMGIVAIASTLALSSMTDLMDSSDGENTMKSLAKAVNFSRVQSVSIGQTVTLCPIVDDICSNDWSKEITIFVDTGNNRTLGANTVLRIIEAIPSQNSLAYSGTSLGIQFFPDGSIGENDSGIFSYYLNSSCDLNSRGVDINTVGRARFIEKVTCSA